MHVLEWARTNGCPWAEDLYKIAAYSGHVPVMKWLHSNQYAGWNEVHLTIEGACHGPVLQWLRANGCQWSTGVRGT